MVLGDGYLGGAANNLGVIVGTFVFVTVRKLIVFYKDIFAPFLPFDVVWLDLILLGLALIIILIYKPGGIIPEKPIDTIRVGPVPGTLGKAGGAEGEVGGQGKRHGKGEANRSLEPSQTASTCLEMAHPLVYRGTANLEAAHGFLRHAPL